MPTAQLGEVCEIISGATPKTGTPEYWDGDVAWATPKDLSDLGQKHLTDTPRKLTRLGFESCSAAMLPPQSVLLSSRAPIGLVAINTIPVCTNQGFKNLIPRNGSISADYLYWWLKCNNAFLQSLGRGATFKEVSKAIVSRIEIPLPPLAEQKRIAGILDAADALRAKRREALAQLDTLLQATFLDLFGDPVTNPKGWKQSKLGSLCDVGSSKRVFVEELVNEGIPFYRGTEVGALGEGKLVTPTLFITAEHYEELKKESGVPYPGDLLLPSICPDGRIHIVRDERPFYFKDGRVLWIKAGESSINSVFLRYHLKHLFAANYAKIASGTTFAELKIFALKALVVHVPPIEQQEHFVRFVDTCERQITNCRSHLAELDTLFASLQSRAFRGKV